MSVHTYFEPNLDINIEVSPIRDNTTKALEFYKFEDNTGKVIDWTLGQLEIIDCIVNRCSPDDVKRIEIVAATQYGKSLAVAAGVIIRATVHPEFWAIVAGTTEKARIIMDYIIMFSLNSDVVRTQLTPGTQLDRLRMKKSVDRLSFRRKGEIRVFSADARRASETSKSLMGFGCIPEGYKVLTDKGEIEIRELVEKKKAKKVWTFNCATQKLELQPILNYQDNPLGGRGLIEVEVGRSKFRCTQDHPVWIKGEGYQRADTLKKGDVLVGFGLMNSMDFGILNTCRLFVKFVKKSFRNVLAMLRELIISFVVGSVEVFHKEVQKIQTGKSLEFVSNVVKSLKQKVKSFVRGSVWGRRVKAKNIIGILVREKNIINGKEILFHIRDYILGLARILKKQTNVNIVANLKHVQDLFIGQIKVGSIKEHVLIGLGCVPYVIKSTTSVDGSSSRVYNIEVANNHNYFIEGILAKNSQNVIQDEAALVGDTLQATIMRMLGGHRDNFLVKIGNPFNRGHFWKTWRNGKYHRIFIDYKRGLDEGRFTASFIEEMATEAMFDILYECKFPPADRIDSKGWMVLLTEDEIRRAFVENDKPFGFKRLGCDVAGGGRNYSVIVMRSYNVAQKIYKHREPDTMQFTGTVMVTANSLGVKDKDIAIDKVGIGKGSYDRLVEQKNAVVGVGGADSAVDSTRFINKRAEMYWRAREWILRGGKLRKDSDWFQLTEIKYKVADSSGKIKIMSKEEMLRDQIDSPDVGDAFAMTFASSEPIPAIDNRSSGVDEAVMPENVGDPYE